MRIIAYKMMTHARFVGFLAFKDGNKNNYNKMNIKKVGLNDVINDIIDKKNQTNWDIILTDEERKYIEKYPNDIAKFLYNDI
jgi:hypothetical protein